MAERKKHSACDPGKTEISKGAEYLKAATEFCMITCGNCGCFAGMSEFTGPFDAMPGFWKCPQCGIMFRSGSDHGKPVTRSDIVRAKAAKIGNQKLLFLKEYA